MFDTVDALVGDVTSRDDRLSTQGCDARASNLDVVVIVREMVAWWHATRKDVDHISVSVLLVPVDILALPVRVSTVAVIQLVHLLSGDVRAEWLPLR